MNHEALPPGGQAPSLQPGSGLPPTTPPSGPAAEGGGEGHGLLLGIGAYVMWGFFPLYFVLLSHVSPIEVVAHRAIWGLLFCLISLPIVGRWHRLLILLRNRKAVLTLSLAGLLVALNWTIYVYGVTTDRTLDAALGYFINPLFTVALGVVVLKERVRPLQIAALIFGVLAVIVLVVAYGQVPYIALTLAATFGIYGLLKKQVGGVATPLAGMAVETMALFPLAVGYLVFMHFHGGLSATFANPGLIALLVVSGPLTAIPLMLFAGASIRLPLVMIGLLQYLAPIGQLLVGTLVFHEPLPPERLAGFVLVWVAIILLTVDSIRAWRASHPRR